MIGELYVRYVTVTGDGASVQTADFQPGLDNEYWLVYAVSFQNGDGDGGDEDTNQPKIYLGFEDGVYSKKMGLTSTLTGSTGSGSAGDWTFGQNIYGFDDTLIRFPFACTSTNFLIAQFGESGGPYIANLKKRTMKVLYKVVR